MQQKEYPMAGKEKRIPGALNMVRTDHEHERARLAAEKDEPKAKSRPMKTRLRRPQKPDLVRGPLSGEY